MLMGHTLDAHSHIYFYKHFKIFTRLHQRLHTFQEYLDSKYIRKKDQNMKNKKETYKELLTMEKTN